MSSSKSNFDAWLDAELRNVPLPAGLLERLEKIAGPSDEELDAALRDVPVPASLARRLKQIGEPAGRTARRRHLATAAAILLAVGLGYFGLMLSLLATVRPAPKPSPPRIAARWKLAGPPEGETVDLGELAVPIRGAEADALREAPGPSRNDFAIALPAEQGESQAPEGVGLCLPKDVDLNVNLARWPEADVRALYSTGDDLEAPKKVPGLKPRGMHVPLVFGYDVPFLSKTGFHPFVCPAVNPQLRTVVAPLDADTESYDLARRYLEDGELPPRTELRTEEFLAAIDYQYPRPDKEALRLFVAGGPSPFHGPHLQLLQLGVQAKTLSSGPRPPVRLTLVVDVSGSMRWGGRMEMVRRALDRLVTRLGARDRVSLVVFGQSAYPLIENATRREQAELRAAIGSLRAQGFTNLTAGLRWAYALAQCAEPADERANRVVLLTDGLARPDPATATRIRQRLAEAVARGIQLHVIDLGQEREDNEPDPFLNDLAHHGGGHARRATSIDRIGWALDEILTGRSPLVAADVQLRLTFNPKAVKVYRLLGHEPRTVVALKPAQTQTDFYAGQSGTLLYELHLVPKGADDVALAELTWRDPQKGEVHRITHTIHRTQLAAYWHEAAVPLQAAAMVAEAAEQLRGSLPLFNPAWPQPGSLEPVRQLSRQVDSRLLERPTYLAFLELLEQAAAARPYRSGGDLRARPSSGNDN